MRVYSDEFTLSQSHLTLTSSATDVSCANGNDGTLTATTSGASSLSYSWSMFDNKAAAEAGLAAKTDNKKFSSATIKNVAKGFYYVAVTDGACTLFGDIVEVSEPKALSLSTSAITVTSCDNTVANGQIIVRADGGTAPYTLTLDGANIVVSETGDYNYSGILTGNHTISLYDANGCTYSGNPAVNVPIYSKVEMSVSNYTMDDSENGTGDATINIVGGVASSDNYTYEVTLTGSTSGTAKNVHISTADATLPTGVTVNKDAISGLISSVDVKFTGLAADTYLVTVRDAQAASNSCSATDAFTLNKLAITCTDRPRLLDPHERLDQRQRHRCQWLPQV